MLYQKLRLPLLVSMGFAVIVLGWTCKSEYLQEEPVCFESEVLPIFISSCTQSGCHNATDREKGRDYSTYEGIMKDVEAGNFRASEVYKVITLQFGDEAMPPKPYSRLSDDQIRTIAIWIEEGATNDSCSTTVQCDTSGVISYTAQVKPILQNWCNSCHGGTATAGGGISLSSHAGVKASVDNGSLIGSIEHASGYSAMPKNGNKLSNCQIATIRKWAENGALNN